jgi:serine/threonine protein phosphatase PrpC
MADNRKWRVVGASVVGTAHEKTGQPCQDAHGWRILPDNVLIAAVADGAGSAALGEIGAQVAVRAVLGCSGKGDFVPPTE